MKRTIKAAVASLYLVLSFVFAAPAQTPIPADLQQATDEVVRRQALTIELRRKLVDAQTGQKKGDNFEAARLYAECVLLVKKVGDTSGNDIEQKQVVAGVVAVRLHLADQAQRNNDFTGADLHADAILAADPRNDLAIKFKQQNAEAKRKLQGMMPDEQALAHLPEAYADKTRANTLAQNGKLLFEAGKLEEAETNLLQAIRLDPLNRPAFYYLDLIREKRHLAENLVREDKSKQWMLQVDRAWRGDDGKRDALPQPNIYARTNLVHTSKLREQLFAKLDRIHLDQVQFDGLPLGEVVKQLSDEAKKRDPDKIGVNFLLNANIDPVNAAPGIDPGTGLPAAPAGEVADLSQTTIKVMPP